MVNHLNTENREQRASQRPKVEKLQRLNKELKASKSAIRSEAIKEEIRAIEKDLGIKRSAVPETAAEFKQRLMKKLKKA